MRIAITGIGAVSAIGMNCTQTLDALLNERSGLGVMRHLRSAHAELVVGEVPCSDEQLRALLNIGAEPLPRTSLLGIAAAREALAMAKLQPSNSMAFISGTTVGGMDLTEQHWSDYAEGKAAEYIRLHEAGESTMAIARHLTNDQMVNIFTPSTACSSALNAIILGANLIRTGQVKQALVGGSESLSRFHLNGFNTLMILDAQPCRPFDADRHGLNLGEGAGYIVLENEEDAIRRGATILGYIAGYANTCDAFHQTASSENGEGAYLAMTKALEMAHLQPADIDYVNAHATSTHQGDMFEAIALDRLFHGKHALISSTKSMTGHECWMAGASEAVYSILMMQHHFVAPNINFENPDEFSEPLNLATQTIETEINTVLSNSFGFGGTNSALVIKSIK